MNPMLATATLVALLGTNHAAKLCNPGWIRGVGKAPKICANDHPDFEAGLCYKECDKGYEGIGPICWEKCKPEETDHGAVCHVAPEMADWYDRGAGKIPKDCGEGKEMQAGLCYTKCDPGYSGIATLCYQDCPGGYEDSGRPGLMCKRHILDFFWKKSYGRGVGRPAKCCPKGEEYIAGLCYPVPKEGYSCVATHCRECRGAFGDCPDKPKSRGSGCGDNEPPKPKPKPPQPVCDATCGCGYRFSNEDVHGEGKQFTHPGKNIEDCANACSKRAGCTGFEFNYKGTQDYACGTYTGQKILNGVRLGHHLDWKTCIVDDKKPEPPKPEPKEEKPEPGTRLKGTHTRGVGIIPSICDNGWEKAIALCYPKCGAGYFGFGIFCQSENFRDNHFPSLEHSLPSVRDVMETCSLDLVVDTILHAKDFNNIQFGAKDMDKCLMENVNNQLDDQWDQEKAVTAIEIAMGITDNGNGLLQYVMSLPDIEFAEYGDFKNSCSKHGSLDALDKFDDFLRWFYDEVKVKDRKNVYVGIAFEPMPKNDQPKQPQPQPSGCDPTCGCGYRFIPNDINGEKPSKQFTYPGKNIEDCAEECSKRAGCTGFEFNSKGNRDCGTYTGHDIGGVRDEPYLDWKTCIVDTKPNPPKPAGSYDKGLGVYFYYGACEGGKVSIGSNIVVYRSVDDIASKRQSYAPFTELKIGDKINVNSMYGLSENGCSLNYMGVSLDSKETKDWFDWDGHECKAEGVLRLN